MKLHWKSKLRNLWSNWGKPFLIVIVVLSTFRSAIADWNDVPSGSMRPTILEGDRIFVNKLAYDLKFPFTTWRMLEWAQPRRGDVVVLFAPDTGVRLVKRVVAVPGDVVELRSNRLYINRNPIAYKPLDSDTIGQIDPEKRSGYQFAEEVFDDRGHPMMTAPRIAGPRNHGPIALGEQQFFVMGDNRDNSRDSRSYGPVDRSLIVGRVPAVAFSLDLGHYYLPRWNRFFRSVP